jgi:fatty acid desaturase
VNQVKKTQKRIRTWRVLVWIAGGAALGLLSGHIGMAIFVGACLALLA